MSNLTKQEVNSCADEFIFTYNVVYFAWNIILNWKPEKAWFFFLTVDVEFCELTVNDWSMHYLLIRVYLSWFSFCG